MKSFFKLVLIGLFTGTILASILILIYNFTGNQVYLLLFNVDYIPVLNDLYPKYMIGIGFHFIFCIASVALLFYLLKLIHLERKIYLYVVIYTGGSALLFFLTLLSEKPPFITDYMAWIYWAAGHAIYAIAVGLFIKYWI